jgi:hypothetical protein
MRIISKSGMYTWRIFQSDIVANINLPGGPRSATVRQCTKQQEQGELVV